MTFWWFIQALSLPIAAIAAVTDTRSGRIPNWLTLPSLALALCVHGALGGLLALAYSALGVLLCAFVPYLLFRKGAVGGGDVKLFAAIGALGGASFGLEAQLLSLFLATAFVLCRLTWRGQLGRTLLNSLRLLANNFVPKTRRREIQPEAMTSTRLGLPIMLGVALALWIRLPGGVL